MEPGSRTYRDMRNDNNGNGVLADNPTSKRAVKGKWIVCTREPRVVVVGRCAVSTHLLLLFNLSIQH
jgi:hypothetical protein